MEIIKYDSENPDGALNAAVKAIKNGSVVVSPTDTVYGLLANARNAEAVKKVFEIKGRDRSKPLPFFVKDLAMAKSLSAIDDKTEAVLKNSWPGKTTFVLKIKPGAGICGAGAASIALRIPGFPFLNALLDLLGLPLTATSANLAGAGPETRISAIVEQFEKGAVKPDLIIDAGDLEESQPSKIIDLTGSIPAVLRN